MAFDLVSSYAASDTPFFVAGQTGRPTLAEAPQQIMLRFSPGVKIDPSTLGSITIVQSGGANDPLGNGTDRPITLGSITVDDLPNENQVVIRFADTLTDDSYRITIGGGLKTLAEGSTPAQVFQNGSPLNLDLRLDVGAYVVAVVPQPISRQVGGLSQNRDSIDVFFNLEDPLSKSSAERSTSYRLFEVDPATGVETLVPANGGNPTGVAYDTATGKASLSFAAGTIADGKLFRLQVGAAEPILVAAPPVAEGTDENSSFVTAQNLGVLDAAGATVSGVINVRPTVPTPAGSLPYPRQFASIDAPGHRNIPTDSGSHGNATVAPTPASPVVVQAYNFQDRYGNDPQGNPLHNAITEAQKQRAREVFELFSRYTGIRFVETLTDGMTVATGDPRAADPSVPPMSVGGIAGVAAIMNSNLDWGQSEYGGSWFQVAMHEIGHMLRLEHSYDLPSIMGKGLAGEPVFPGDYDTEQLNQYYPANGSDIDVYRFTLPVAGTISAETIVARPGRPAASTLDSVLTLYREVDGKRELIARNDDFYGRDSFVNLDLGPGTYYVTVTSVGNDAFNPEVNDSGSGGRSDGAYQLKLGFQPNSTAATTIVDASGTQLDGDRDGQPGGAFSFWFNTASTANTVYVDKVAAGGGDGSINKPFNTIKSAIDGIGSKSIIRIVGNNDNVPYLIGTTLLGAALPDGRTFNVPKGVTVMIDEAAVFKLRAAAIDVGSSSGLVSRAGASIQVLGTPGRTVKFTSYHDDLIGGNSDGVGPAVSGGQWGGIVLREDSDTASRKAFVNSICQATITYGGGQVLVDSKLESFAPIQLESTRPTIAFNTITNSAGAAIAADPNSFEDSDGRTGPGLRGNKLLSNSINGLFVKIRTDAGRPIDTLDVPARFQSTDIVYVLQENLSINGGVGGYEQKVDPTDGIAKMFARQSGRLSVAPGVVVKLQGSRIELERGTAQLLAEGTAGQRVIFTSLGDNRFGAGGTFDTNGNLPDKFDDKGRPIGTIVTGDWGGIVINAGAKASIDQAYVAFGGGQTPIEGGFDQFNVIEVHQGDLRLAHSRIERNAGGLSSLNRTGRGTNAASTIFVRGAQPVIVGNDFRDNAGAVISINANSLNDVSIPDAGRSSGLIDRDARFDDNRGPLVRSNRLSYSVGENATVGMEVRGEEITVESVWDDVDCVHVVRNEIIVQNFHTATGVRLISQPDASLIVKLAGANAGFTAAGYGLDIDDRIGGTVQVVGQPGYPVILTALADDSVGASLDSLGQLVKDTNNNGDSTGKAGDWRSLKFLPSSNDTNVAIVQESEKAATGGIDTNSTPGTAELLGVLAPDLKSGGENRRLGFEVHGRIASDTAGDVDVYSFLGAAGSEVWIEIDKTSPSLDTMIELLDAAGNVLARSADSLSDSALSAVTRGAGADLGKDAFNGGDFYSVNPKDAGMRVVLPLAGGAAGQQRQYYVRVRSQPRYDATTTKSQYESDLADPSKVAAGATAGSYELRVRLRQRDDKPGSTVRYADIRYPTVGIDVQGLPNHSPLTGETGENATGSNELFASAQYVGNLLQSDRNTISIAGAISDQNDVDWYKFALNYEEIQSISGYNGGTKTWSSVFDLDYGDGFRGDLTLSVFDSTGKLIYVGRDSNVQSDQPAAGGGNSTDDLSRGSFGKLDPFIGSVQMPAGNPTGSADVESGAPAAPPDPTRQLVYYVAVSSNERLPTALNAMFNAGSTNTSVRLEPVNSVTRIAEDHIGFTGYTSGTKLNPSPVLPTTGPLIDIAKLSTHVTPFTLSDVTLFVSTTASLFTVDAMRGVTESTIVKNEFGANDLLMRSDGKLYSYSGIKDGANYAGQLNLIDSGTGGRTAVGNDGIADPPDGAASNEFNIAGQSSGASQTRFTLAKTTLVASSVTGEVSYAGSSNGNPFTGYWSFAAGAGGAIAGFGWLGGPGGPPAGFPVPVSGQVNGTTGIITINWSAAVASAGASLTQVTYNATGAPGAVKTDNVDAMAWQRTKVGEWKNLFYSVREGGRSRLYQADPSNGSAAFVDKQPWGYKGVIQDPTNSLGTVTGMAFVGTTLYGVDTKGFLFTVNSSTAVATLIDLDSTTPGDNPLPGVAFGGFGGLAIGPQNLEGGRFKDMLFAIDAYGALRAFNTSGTDPVGTLQQVFDSDNDGIADATEIPTYKYGATGLAFSPLDVNLWHPTLRRGGDAGHGVNTAPDDSRNGDIEKVYWGYKGGIVYGSETAGAQSMYFGLQQYDDGPFTDFYADATGGQYGSSTAWHADLSTNADIVNNYNLPGGAYGSLTTNPFSLAGYDSIDKPTLYFNYWLQTQGAASGYRDDLMRDSARAFISTDGGLTWEVVATNNSARSPINTSDGELPAFTSASARAASSSIDNQHVQELYDTANWRQARIDLGKYAGQANIRLRFDFSTAGVMDATQSRAVSTTVAANVSASASVIIASTDGIIPGMTIVATGVDPTTKVVSVDAGLGVVVLSSPVTLAAGDAIGFTMKLNDIKGYANILGDFRGAGSAERGQNNKFEGFYIDDIIVGLAERGEMVTSSQSGQTDFFDVGTPVGEQTVPSQSLQGPYQLNIRRGTEYGSTINKLESDIAITRTFDTNADLVASNGALGDANMLREQGQFLIENNTVRNAFLYGVSIDAGTRAAGTNAPAQGVTQNLQVLNNSRLVPGVVVNNNIISSSGTAGILFSGDPNTGSVPTAAVPFGRIVNNTIYGGDTPNGVGVSITENAGPTLLNNLFANLATGVSVDASSGPRTVVGASAYFGTTTQATGVVQSQQVVLDGNPFVNAAKGNFYLASGSKAIDSAVNSLADRNDYVVVTSPLGIPQSPIIAPDRDLFGQLRDDDPSQSSLPGLGSNAFKDRGAVDRVDFTQPRLSLLEPLDNSVNDKNLTADVVRLEKEAARSITQFTLQLDDLGVGIDRSTVTKEAFQLTRNGTTLVEGTDYMFRYLEKMNRVVFEAAAVFPLGAAYTISATSRASASGVTGLLTDLANNTLLPNKADGKTTFTIELADVPGIPGGVSAVAGDQQATINWSAAGDNGSPVTNYLVQYSADGGTIWTTFERPASTSTTAVVTGLVNRTSYVFRVAAVNAVGSGEFTNATGPVTPFGLPTAPLNLQGMSGDGRVALTWNVPSSDGGSTIIDYVVQFGTDGVNWTVYGDGVLDTTGATVTGLANGTSYLFRVAARTQYGDGTAAVSGVVKPVGLPTAPGRPQAVGSDQWASISWQPAVANGGTISDYLVQYRVTGGSGWTDLSRPASTALTAEIPGLTNGSSYTFRVAAVNEAGTGNWSQESNLVTPSRPASASGLVSVNPGDSAVTVSWSTPTDNGGSPISGYRIEYRQSKGATWTPFTVGVVNTATVRGLVNGTAYVVRVAAITGAGPGDFSVESAAVTPRRPLLSPTSVTAVRGNTSATVSWRAPSSNGGSAITGYAIQASSDGGLNWTDAPPAAANATRTDVSGLSNATAYVFRVAAVNAFGRGAWSSAVALTGPASAPAIATAVSRNGSVQLGWTTPSDLGGRALTGYRIEYKLASAVAWTPLLVGSSVTSRLVTGLTNGSSYVFRVAAVTGFGTGLFSTPTGTLKPIGPAAAPSSLRATAGDAKVSLTWAAPTATGGSPISGYVVQYRATNSATWLNGSPVAANIRAATVSGLANGTSYIFRVAAVTTFGPGTFAVSSTVKPIRR